MCVCIADGFLAEGVLVMTKKGRSIGWLFAAVLAVGITVLGCGVLEDTVFVRYVVAPDGGYHYVTYDDGIWVTDLGVEYVLYDDYYVYDDVYYDYGYNEVYYTDYYDYYDGYYYEEDYYYDCYDPCYKVKADGLKEIFPRERT